METKTEINLKIMEITDQIRENHPELLKYLNEMPVTIPDEKNPKITLQSLQDYYQSLLVLLRNYLKDHPIPFKQTTSKNKN